MRISEIISESAIAETDIVEASIFDERTLKNTAWESPKQLVAWLKSNGFEKLGGGVFAAAWAKPGHNRVVKVSNRQDDCWIKFAQWSMAKTNNTHLPKIPWIKRYQGKRKGIATEFFITIIERLKPLTKTAIARINDPGVLLGLMHYANLDYNTEQSIEKAMSKQPNPQQFSDRKVLTKYKNHPFIKAIQQISNISGDCWSDLHSGNLMVRNDGTIIITDPIAGDFT